MIHKNFSKKYKKLLEISEINSKQMGFKELTCEDVFINILEKPEGAIKELFNIYGINKKLILETYDKSGAIIEIEKRKGVYSGMSKELKDVILFSVKVASNYSKENATIEDLLIALIKKSKFLSEILNYIGVDSKDFESQIEELNKMGSQDGSITKVNDSSIDQLIGNIFGDINNMNQEQTPFDGNKEIPNQQKNDDSNTPALDFFSTNLNKEAAKGDLDKVIGREKEIERLIAILNRKTKNNPVLVGEPGVGKTAIVEGLALKILQGEVPFSMKDKKILSLDMSSLVAGTKYRGEFENRIKQIIDEASKVENEVILFIDEIHTIIGAGGTEGTLDASNILKPAMGRGKIRVIGATTLKEYEKYIEKDSALERRFQKINADEPNKETAVQIIGGLKETFEEYHNLSITDSAINEAIDLSIRYITDRFLPDKAIDLIDEACSIKSMKYNFDEKEIKQIKEKIVKIQKKIEDAVISQQYKKASTLKEEIKELEEKISDKKRKFSIPKSKRLKVTESDVQKVLSIATGIPTEDLNKNEIDRLKKLPKVLNSQIIGQEEAIDSIVKSIMRSKAGINNPNRPLGSFLFLGPTGVGKTEIVKKLSKEYYSDEKSLIKIDMSEYSDKTGAAKLIGANAGYIGYEDGGLLTEKVRKKPYSIVLFDEIEKGDFEVYNLLLQILEEGQITDSKGRIINFRNTIIIMTSNIGQEEFSEKASSIGFSIGEDEEEKAMKDFTKAKETIKGNLTEYFSPEFINRIDKIIVFNPLNKNNIKKIVKLQLEDLEKRLKDKEIKLKYDNKIINFITKNVYNPEFGAREIRRYISDNIEDSIANKLISGKKTANITLEISKNNINIK